jgi:hypothetical protein
MIGAEYSTTTVKRTSGSRWEGRPPTETDTTSPVRMNGFNPLVILGNTFVINLPTYNVQSCYMEEKLYVSAKCEVTERFPFF